MHQLDVMSVIMTALGIHSPKQAIVAMTWGTQRNTINTIMSKWSMYDNDSCIILMLVYIKQHITTEKQAWMLTGAAPFIQMMVVFLGYGSFL